MNEWADEQIDVQCVCVWKISSVNHQIITPKKNSTKLPSTASSTPTDSKSTVHPSLSFSHSYAKRVHPKNVNTIVDDCPTFKDRFRTISREIHMYNHIVTGN